MTVRRRTGEQLPAGYAAADIERLHVEAPKTATLSMARPYAGREPFVRDRARVLHSAAFRRLAGKTQVVAPDDADVPRTRLTHSLEVAQIARDIGRQLGCDADLVDLAGLAHDIGHPPFGHNGEAALDALAAGIGGFEANAQNLRLLTRLELKVLDGQGRPVGLNLTRASLDAVIKYPWQRPPGGGKFGVYADDQLIFDWVRTPSPAADRRSLEAQVMDWADDVAYSVHDVEDGVQAGVIGLRLLMDPSERAEVIGVAARYSPVTAGALEDVFGSLLDLPAVAQAIVASGGSPVQAGAALKMMTSELTGRFASGAVAATRKRHDNHRLTRYDADLEIPPVLRSEVALLKAVAAHYVMADPARRSIQQRQQQLLTELVTGIAERGPDALDPLFAGRYAGATDDGARLRVVVDQVSLLTDAQAVTRHRVLSARESADRPTGADPANP